jgi:hypothetical protein
VKVRINAAYHQFITNYIKSELPYGQGAYDPVKVNQVLIECYKRYPLPGNPEIPMLPE